MQLFKRINELPTLYAALCQQQAAGIRQASALTHLNCESSNLISTEVVLAAIKAKPLEQILGTAAQESWGAAARKKKVLTSQISF